MLVIIPNPNDLLLLSNFQKSLLKTEVTEPLFRAFPLWIPIPETSENISPKDYSRTISKIIIEAPDKTGKCQVKIAVLDGGVAVSELQLIAAPLNQEINLKNLSSQDLFPMSLKVFRVGIKNQISKNSFSISDDCWVKLKH